MGYIGVDMLKWSRAAAVGDPRASADGKRGIRQIGQPLHLAAHRRHDIEDQSGEEAQETDDDQSHAEHGRRQPGHEPGFEIGLSERNRERDGDKDEGYADKTEKLQRALVAHEIEDEPKDPAPVAKAAELAHGSRRSLAIHG